MSKIITLNKGYSAVVDDEDYDWLMQWRWSIHRETRWGLYAKRGEKGRIVYMHRQIMNAPKGLQVDHINGDTFDNRKSNLRLCTNSQNTKNKKLSKKSTTGYKGVTWQKQISRYQARIRVNGELIHLGMYENAKDAARAYNAAASIAFGEFARLNDID